MNKRITEIFCLITRLIAMPALAQDKSEENFNFAHSKVSFSGLVTLSDSYRLEASYHYMLDRHIGLGGAFASMPPHSSHAQMAARFFGCALIIVPPVRGYMFFRPRMDFDGQNHAGRPSRQSYVKIPSEWRWCV